MRKTISQAMKEVLEETDSPAVMWGDAVLFNECSKKLGHTTMWRPTPAIVYSRILDALQTSPLFNTYYVPINLGQNSFHNVRLCYLKDKDPKEGNP